MELFHFFLLFAFANRPFCASEAVSGRPVGNVGTTPATLTAGAATAVPQGVGSATSKSQSTRPVTNERKHPPQPRPQRRRPSSQPFLALNDKTRRLENAKAASVHAQYCLCDPSELVFEASPCIGNTRNVSCRACFDCSSLGKRYYETGQGM